MLGPQALRVQVSSLPAGSTTNCSRQRSEQFVAMSPVGRFDRAQDVDRADVRTAKCAVVLDLLDARPTVGHDLSEAPGLRADR